MDQSLHDAAHETSVAKVIETTKTWGKEGEGERGRERERESRCESQSIIENYWLKVPNNQIASVSL